jgi:hypothetical protein
MDRLSIDLLTTALCSGALYSPLLNICIIQLNYLTIHLIINSLEHNSKKNLLSDFMHIMFRTEQTRMRSV